MVAMTNAAAAAATAAATLALTMMKTIERRRRGRGLFSFRCRLRFSKTRRKSAIVHPRLATVTYLTDFGAPVVDVDQTRLTMSENIAEGYPGWTLPLSLESTWLTGASCDSTSFFQSDHSNGGKPSATIKKKSQDGTTNEKNKTETRKRITLLVNIWLNHCPLDPEPLDDDVCKEQDAFGVKVKRRKSFQSSLSGTTWIWSSRRM
jgi:hypothetical protein